MKPPLIRQMVRYVFQRTLPTPEPSRAIDTRHVTASDDQIADDRTVVSRTSIRPGPGGGPSWAWEILRGGERADEIIPDPTGSAATGSEVIAAGMRPKQDQFDDADRTVPETERDCPDSPSVFVALARDAEANHDWVGMAAAYSVLRARFPCYGLGYAGGAHALREINHFDEADALLNSAKVLFPNEALLFVEHARIAEARGDWALVAERYAEIRTRFPGDWRGYTGGAQALCQLGQISGAENVLEAGQLRLPEELRVFIDHARLAEGRNDWVSLASRCAAIRERFPEHPWAYTGGATALRGLGRLDDAEALLTDAKERFPADPTVLIQHARAAHDRRDWERARDRCLVLRESLPDVEWGYIGGANALDRLGHRAEARSLLEAGLARSPAAIELLEAYCWMAHREGDWSEALTRWGVYRDRYPDRAVCYSAASVPLRELARFDEAEALVVQGLRRHPGDSELLANHAFVACSRKDWTNALERWTAYRDRFPDHAISYVHTGIAYRELTRFDEADAIIQDGLDRFPNHAELVVNFAWTANQKHDWPEALRRWRMYCDLVPGDPRGHRQITLVLQELERFDDVLRISRTESPTAEDSSVARLMLEFESLGENCEFGIVQRHFGAEPWGLLRFTATPPGLLIQALEARFAGVGESDNIVLDVQDGEYMTTDKRYHMLTHTFISENEHDRDDRLRAVSERLRFVRARMLPHLRDKLIADLTAAEKIFVYGCGEPLHEDVARALWTAIRSYGDNHLLFVRLCDERNAPGTVRVIENGLYVGYIDKFSVSDPSVELWLKLCRQARMMVVDGSGTRSDFLT